MELAAGTHFFLLVILGVISGTNFRENIRHPRAGGPGWYHRLDVEADDAAAAIIRAIAAERTRLVIPGWYGPLIRLNHLLSPVTKAALRLAKRRV